MPQPGEIWLAEIPFTSGVAAKRRPVLVLWVDAADVVVAAVTSAAVRSSTDVPLQDWSAEGLRAASATAIGAERRRGTLLRRTILRRFPRMVADHESGPMELAQ
jgi:mRNA-degrading endonuclease toxin of MazEF toxin-antitoxin module